MKKTLFVLFAIVFVASICFAEESLDSSSVDDNTNSDQNSSDDAVSSQAPIIVVVPAKQPRRDNSLPPGTVSTFTGKVDWISSDKEITLKDDSDHVTTFTVASGAVILGKDGKPTTLNWLSRGEKVNVEYVTNPDLTKTIKSIKTPAGL